MKFIDHTTVSVQAGSGGMGCIAFLREKHRPKGGPCGGDGGNGGNVIFSVNPQLLTLQDVSLKSIYKAENGAHGLGKNMHGKNAKDIFIQVPQGTLVKDSSTKHIIADLVKNEETFLIAKGGNGGFGNAKFKTQNITAPRVANEGKKGESKTIELELKVLADVGLVGLPNAGKSTFISKVSNAKPKIADYPFTTLTPNLGIVRYQDYKTFVIADIPGLIKDASKGKGLGSIFLKHIERTKALVFMIDVNDESIEKTFKTLFDELKSHKTQLVKKPFIVLITKTDTILSTSISKFSKDFPIIPISSISGDGLQKAISQISKLLK